MFGTQMHLITLVILVFQTLVLFAQLLFIIARPNDRSRQRFLWLVVSYIFYNLCSGLFPDQHITIPMTLQIILAYASGIVVAVYFIYYTYKEFNIYPFKLFKVRSLLYTLCISFILLFVLPYLYFESLTLSRRLFLAIPVLVAVAFFIQVTRSLIEVYRKGTSEGTPLFKYRIFAGNLGLFSLALMPVIVVIGDYQSIEQSVVNFGFIVFMTVYVAEVLIKSQQEMVLLDEIEKKAQQPTTYEMQIDDQLIADILVKLEAFEAQKDFNKGKITLGMLAKRFGTNSRYLSLIVNKHKHKSFTDYINHLRIDYAKERLEVDEKFRHYTLSAISKELGYKRVDAFQRAFQKKEKINFKKYLEKFNK